MKPSDMVSAAVTQSANDSHRTGPKRTTYVFVFVAVYIEKKSDATVRPTTHGSLAKFRRVFLRQDRHLQPFWTWFIDNPRPESLKWTQRSPNCADSPPHL
jgi:hypothetical protein